jgi:hypothetical protein
MFKTVEIKKGKDTIQASKTYKVLESTVDERDDLIYLTLELPKGSSGVKSNDESTKG